MSDQQLTIEEAEQAAQNDDTVTHDELQEMYQDQNLNQIECNLAEQQEFADAETAAASTFEEPRWAARQGRKTYHTGPKGVLTDYEEAKLKLRAKRLVEKDKRTKKVYMQLEDDMAQVTPFQLVEQNKTKVSSKSLRRERNTNSNNLNDTDSDSDDGKNDQEEDEIEDPEDAAILLSYKMQRLEMIEAHRPRFGVLMECTVMSFKKQVEDVPKGVFTVMTIYQDYIKRCAELNKCLSMLAYAYKHVQFLCARSDRIALVKYPDVGLPTLIIWRNGEQVTNFVAVHNQLGNPFDVHVVEDFLIKHKVITKKVVLPEKPQKSDGTWNNRKTLDIIRKRMRKNKVQAKPTSNKFEANGDSDSDSLDID